MYEIGRASRDTEKERDGEREEVKERKKKVNEIINSGTVLRSNWLKILTASLPIYYTYFSVDNTYTDFSISFTLLIIIVQTSLKRNNFYEWSFFKDPLHFQTSLLLSFSRFPSFSLAFFFISSFLFLLLYLFIRFFLSCSLQHSLIISCPHQKTLFVFSC